MPISALPDHRPGQASVTQLAQIAARQRPPFWAKRLRQTGLQAQGSNISKLNIRLRPTALRKGKKLSQRKLASRTGVTNGMISIIEQNKISPSVGNIKKILDGIPIDLADFFMEDAGDAPKTFYRHAKLAVIRTSALYGREAPLSNLTRLQVGQPGTHNLMMSHETYDVGAVTAKPFTATSPRRRV